MRFYASSPLTTALFLTVACRQTPSATSFALLDDADGGSFDGTTSREPSEGPTVDHRDPITGQSVNG
uniref:Secreted protein n=1 Tax=Steinernema glaseri TaxID=37863 RepID=A0A1I7YZL5_9BILA